jgi:hypothetical protein
LFCDSFRPTNVLIQDASVFVFTPADRLLQVTPVLSGTVFLMVLYGTPKAEAQEPNLVGLPSIAIGNLSLPDDGLWRFCISGAVCSQSMYETTRGLFILVPEEGTYSIVAEGSSRGFLGPSESEYAFMASSSGTFVSSAYFTSISATATASDPARTSPNATPHAPSPSANPVLTQTWPPIEEPEPEEWKPVRYIGLILAAVSAIVLILLVAADVARTMRRSRLRRDS